MISLTELSFFGAEQKAAGQPYSYYARCLQEIGVLYYEVDVAKKSREIHSATGDYITIPGEYPWLKCAPRYNESALKTALKKTQDGKTDYADFLQEIAAAGIHRYIADLENGTITYIGWDPDDRYIEAISRD